MNYLLVIVVVVVLLIVVRLAMRRVTIFEYEKGLKYSKGKHSDTLGPGQYWYFPYTTTIKKVDVRPRFASITGQEVISSDGVTLKVSIAAQYEISDPYTAINKVESYPEALHLQLQLALRQIIGSAPIDELLEKRDQFGRRLAELTDKKIQEIGLKLLSVNIKDIMFPGDLKKIFAQVVKAQKEGQAALEKARSETAALRSLANAARLIEGNPNLLQLRLIQSLGETSGNTVVLGLTSMPTTLPIRVKEAEKPAGPPPIPPDAVQ